MEQITITNEQEAFELIQRALKDEIGDHFDIIFDGWPKLTITLEGEGYAGTITPSLMEALVEFQAGLNRTYAKVVYNQPDGRHLKAHEKQDLEFKAKVEEGCTKVTVDLSDFVKNIASQLVSKMEAKHVIVLSVVGAAMWVSDTAVKAHYEAEVKTKIVQEETIKATKLSEEETARVALITQALTANHALAGIQKDANDARISLLKGISDADSIEINGVSIKKEDARVLASSKRSSSTDVQANGNYQILAVDTSHPDEIKIRVHKIDDGREFTAKFRDQSLDQSQIGILQDAEWARKKVYLSVNATELRGQITTATIISVTKQPD